MSMCKSLVLEFSNTQFLDWAVVVSPLQKRCQSHPLNYKLRLEPKLKECRIWCFDLGITIALRKNNSNFPLAELFQICFKERKERNYFS